jgi:hypothetical protein
MGTAIDTNVLSALWSTVGQPHRCSATGNSRSASPRNRRLFLIASIRSDMPFTDDKGHDKEETHVLFDTNRASKEN